jgi:hypothetical protein
LELGSLNHLMADLRARGIVTKLRSLKSGRTVGGIPFTRGPFAHSAMAHGLIRTSHCACQAIEIAPAQPKHQQLRVANNVA